MTPLRVFIPPIAHQSKRKERKKERERQREIEREKKNAKNRGGHEIIINYWKGEE